MRVGQACVGKRPAHGSLVVVDVVVVFYYVRQERELQWIRSGFRRRQREE